MPIQCLKTEKREAILPAKQTRRTHGCGRRILNHEQAYQKKSAKQQSTPHGQRPSTFPQPGGKQEFLLLTLQNSMN
jgi:hypothetical protein